MPRNDNTLPTQITVNDSASTSSSSSPNYPTPNKPKHMAARFFKIATCYLNQLIALGLSSEQIAAIDPRAIAIITIQLEELQKNSPLAFKNLQQNFLDTGIFSPAIFCVEVDTTELDDESCQALCDQAAEYNNVALVCYLISDNNPHRPTPVQNTTLAKICYAGNLPMLRTVLNVMHTDHISEAEVSASMMIILSQNYSVMQWVLETLTTAGDEALKQKIHKEIKLTPNDLIKAAILGGKDFGSLWIPGSCKLH